MNSKLKEYISGLLLLLAALVWGSAFVAQEMAKDVPAYTFNGVRMFLGALVLLPFIFIKDKTKPETKIGWTKETLIAGLICGSALFLASSMQQLGITMGTTGGKSGFITALYIVMVPVLGVFLKKSAGINIWIAVAVACVGMYLLCIEGEFSLSKGDALTVLCAIFFAVQILAIDKYVNTVDSVKLSCLQFVVVGILSVPCAFVFEKPTLDMVLSVKGPILYMGIMSCGVAYTLQIISQKNLKPEVASLLMCFESVFAGITGWLILDNSFNRMQIAGCVLMFCAVLISQFLYIPQKKSQF